MSASHDSQCSGLSELLCGFRVWRQLFLKACRTQPQLQTQDIVDGKLFERLVQIRKSGKLEVKATKRARAGDKVDVENWLPVAEIASRRMHLQIGSVKFEPIPQRKRPRGCMSLIALKSFSRLTWDRLPVCHFQTTGWKPIPPMDRAVLGRSGKYPKLRPV